MKSGAPPLLDMDLRRGHQRRRPHFRVTPIFKLNVFEGLPCSNCTTESPIKKPTTFASFAHLTTVIQAAIQLLCLHCSATHANMNDRAWS